MKKPKNTFLSLYVIIMCSVISGCGDNEKDEISPSENVIMAKNESETDSEVLELSENAEDLENSENLDTAENSENSENTTTTANSLKMVSMFSDNEIDVIADGAVLVETSTNTILYEKKLHEKLYPASMTKMITTLVVLDHFATDELIEIGTEINEVPWDSSKAGHIVGEMITVENLLRALIIPSGNDSSNVATVAVAKRFANNDNLSLEECQEIFSDLMNEKATQLGALNSNFVKAHGYHEDDHYTTPYDLAIIAVEFLKHDLLVKIASESSFSGDGANGMFEGNDNAKSQYYNWKSHNLLITDNQYNYPDAIGIKTGYTSQAGQCVAAASINEYGEELVAIIFNSPDNGRWIDGATLFDHGYDDYDKMTIAKKNDAQDFLSLTKHNPLIQDDVALLYEEDIEVYLPIELEQVDYSTEISYIGDYTTVNKDGSISLVAPLEAGQVVGVSEFFINGDKVFECNLIVKDEIEKGTPIHHIQNFFKNFFKNLFSLKTLGIVVGSLAVISFVGRRIRKNRSRRYTTGTNYTFKQNPRRRKFK